MRDPGRIPIILEQLEALWKRSPDLRLTQLIMNVLSEQERDYMYYIEDDVILDKIKG